MSTMKATIEPSGADYQVSEVELAEFFKALSHPARLAILKALADRGECLCGEIVEVLPLAQSTVSQHLKQLKDCGLIRGEIEGVRSCYCIDRERLKAMFSLVKEFEFATEEKLSDSDVCCQEIS